MRTTTLLAATGLALVALSPVAAQNASTATTDPTVMPVADHDDDDSGKWGLLAEYGGCFTEYTVTLPSSSGSHLLTFFCFSTGCLLA